MEKKMIAVQPSSISGDMNLKKLQAKAGEIWKLGLTCSKVEKKNNHLKINNYGSGGNEFQ